jgi:hypothetical protein
MKKYIVIDFLDNQGGDICDTKEDVMEYCGYDPNMDWKEFLILITGEKQVMMVNGEVSWVA